jgi:hypothetical protein
VSAYFGAASHIEVTTRHVGQRRVVAGWICADNDAAQKLPCAIHLCPSEASPWVSVSRIIRVHEPSRGALRAHKNHPMMCMRR